MGRGKAGMTKEPPTQCLLLEARSDARLDPCCLPPPKADVQQPTRTPHVIIPSASVWEWDALPADGDPDRQLLLFHCSWMWPFPIVLPPYCTAASVPRGRMNVASLSWAPWAKPTWDLPEWVACQTTPKWLSSGFPHHQNILWFFFISLPCDWLYPKKSILNYFTVFFFPFLFPHLDQKFYTIPKHWCLHRISYSVKGIFGPIITRIFHAWQIGCRWHHLKFL